MCELGGNKMHKRINQLEDVVKHLILCKQEEEILADHFNREVTLGELYQKDQKHKTVFQKFLRGIIK